MLLGIIDKRKMTIWLRAFHIWQLRPHTVAPLSESSHECATCGTVFRGNFCPRCGQAAQVGRFSFTKALLLFLDVWGMGNRGMFRSIRDLFLRPGYMIRDYLRGMQSAYFPPFKMFFLLTAFSVIVEHGFTFGFQDKEEAAMKQIEVTTAVPDSSSSEADSEEFVSAIQKAGNTFMGGMNYLNDKNPAIFSLLLLILLSLPMYFFFRSTPTIPDLRFSEFFVALVYTSNSFSIVTMVIDLLGLSGLKILSLLMIYISFRQFSGFSRLRLLVYFILTLIISTILLLVLCCLGIFIIYITTK